MSNENRDGESPKAWTDPAVVPPRRHQLRVDLSERNATVLRLARECEEFDVQVVHLPIGDYFIDSGVVVERKTYADFAISLVDGRLFSQAAALAQSPHRPVVLLEGPKPLRMPDVHPDALERSDRVVGGHVAAPRASRARSGRCPCGSCVFLLSKWETRSNALFDGTTASQSASLRGDSTCFRACPVWAQRWLNGC
jgi:hypothetical protein